MDSAPIDLQQIVVDLVSIAMRNDIYDSPIKSGVLLDVCNQLSELKPAVYERVLAFTMSKKATGWTAVHREKTPGYVETATIAQLVHACPVDNLLDLLTALVAALGNVSEAKYLALCEAIGVAPQPDVVKHSEPTVFLRRSNNKNQSAQLEQEGRNS
jgi:hypothetical protein